MHVAKPRAFALLVPLLAGTGLAVVAWAAFRADQGLDLLAVVFLAAVLLELSPVVLNEDIALTTSVGVVFVAIAAGGIGPGVLAAIAIGVASVVSIRQDKAVKTLVNTAIHALSGASAAVIFAAVVGTDLYSPATGDALGAGASWLTIGLLVAGLVYTVVNAVLLSLVVHIASGVPLARTARELAQHAILLQFLHVGLSAITYTLLLSVGWIAIALVFVPLAVARRSLRSVQERQEAYDRMVRAFVKAIELKDGYTRGHAERVSDLSVLVAERMGLSYEQRQLIRYGAILHDVGKIGVSLGVLCKAGPLDDDEFAAMKKHPEIGAEMLADIDFLQPALAIVHHHHERMDGRGYPAGLEGDAIPLLTRVVTAVDAFDAMTSTRSYRRAMPVEVALQELRANAGTQFDAEVVHHLVDVINEHGWELTDEPVAVAPPVPARVQLAASS